jgi:succinoglycan biosynthesis protein ExoM
MTPTLPHITVCVCTYKRPHLLKRLLEDLNRQRTGGRFTFSIVVTDNDKLRSAEQTVTEYSRGGRIEAIYCVEPEQNIALARNRAVSSAKGDFVAMIDDDEFPVHDWLLSLFQTCLAHDVSCVLGPVEPQFEREPPAWVKKAGIFDRPNPKTGVVLTWQEARTGNVLISRKALEGIKGPFRSEFGSGSEDQDFFRRLDQAGRKFIWSREAVVYETVPPIRWKRSFMVRKALQRGKNSLKHPSGRWRAVGKACVAIPIYTVALPFLLLGGQHRFMKYLIKLSDHTGRVVALFGFNPGGRVYVTE